MIKALMLCAGLLGGAARAAEPAPLPPRSEAVYRLPYAHGTRVSVFDDAATHRPAARIDLVGEPREKAVHRIVAAAPGKVMAVQDAFGERQSGRAASACRNNFVWLSHANGEWTLYSHMRRGTSSGKAGLKPGDRVEAGQYLGDEGDVGCAMLSHLHFEVAVPAKDRPIDAGGFVRDNDGSRRNRVPRFCAPHARTLGKGAVYTAAPCTKQRR